MVNGGNGVVNRVWWWSTGSGGGGSTGCWWGQRRSGGGHDGYVAVVDPTWVQLNPRGSRKK